MFPDPALNRVPAGVRSIHLMGICGTGMGALAGMLQAAGYTVSGSDTDVYPPMSDFLAARNIPVRQGYAVANLQPRPDLVVVGNVIRRDNPEAVAMIEAAIPYVSFPQALGHFFIRGKQSLVVCGTHGKTTTASLLASVLHGAGEDPSFMIGGIVQGFNRNFNIGDGACFVAEGDEYDTAFFDKGPKFLHYRPEVAILTSIEFDHADIFADLDAVKAAFRRLVEILPPDGLLFACLDDANVREIADRAPCPVAGYGFGSGCRWQLVELDAGRGEFSVLCDGVPYGRFRSAMAGRHNALNALAVIAVLDHLGIKKEDIAAGIAGFAGVRRRQEVRGEVDGITVIDDFAHHPTAVRETLAALRAAYDGRRLVAVFEPRTNSSRRRLFQEAYAGSFDAADLVLVREPLPHHAIAPGDMFSSRRLAADLRQRGREAESFPSAGAIIDFLAGEARPGDVIAVLSNGGFEDIHSRLLDMLAARRDKAGNRHRVER